MFHAAMQTYVLFVSLVFQSFSQSVFQYFFSFVLSFATGSFFLELSKEVRAEYTEHVRKYLWGDAPFWSNSYFIASTGTTVMEKVKEYNEKQKTEEHKRKYVKSGRYVKKRNWRDIPGNSSPTDALAEDIKSLEARLLCRIGWSFLASLTIK